MIKSISLRMGMGVGVGGGDWGEGPQGSVPLVIVVGREREKG